MRGAINTNKSGGYTRINGKPGVNSSQIPKKPKVIVKTKPILPLNTPIGSYNTEKTDDALIARIPQPYRTSFSAVTNPQRARSSSPKQRFSTKLPLPANDSHRGRTLSNDSRSHRSKTPNYRTTSTVVNSNAGRVSSQNPSHSMRHVNTFGVPVMNSSSVTCYSSLNRSLSSTECGPAGRVSRADLFLNMNTESQTGFDHLYTISPPSKTLKQSQLPQPIKGILVKRSRITTPSSDGFSPSAQSGSPLQSTTSAQEQTPDSINTSICDLPSTYLQSPSEVSCKNAMQSQGKQSLRTDGGDNKIKKIIIQKDYSHTAVLSYKDASLKYKNGGNGALSQSAQTGIKASSVPTSPQQLSFNSSLSNTTTGNNTEVNGGPVKRSLSSSISNFFRKMSPGALRKHGRRALSLSRHPTSRRHQSTDSMLDGSSSSCHGSDFTLTPDGGSFTDNWTATAPSDRGRSKIRASSFRIIMKQLGRSRDRSCSSDKENSVTPEAVKTSLRSTPSPMTNEESIRILRSIESNTEKNNMYQHFKDKQGPKTPDATSNKPLALKAVDVMEVIQKERPKKISPPKTLNVCNVHLKNTRIINLEEMTNSVESIGQCSIISQGSEPGSTKINGQPIIPTSPVLTPDTCTAVDTAVHYNNGGHSTVVRDTQPQTESERTIDRHVGEDLTPLTPNGHAPSYLKLSCSVSGYGRDYKAFSSPTNESTSNSRKGSTGNVSRSSVTPKRHIFGNRNGTVTPSHETIETYTDGVDERTSDCVDSRVVEENRNNRKSQSSSESQNIRTYDKSSRNSGNTSKQMTNAGEKSGDLSCSEDNLNDGDLSHKEYIIRNGPISAFVNEDNDAIAKSCDIDTLDEVTDSVNQKKEIINLTDYDNLSKTPRLQLQTDILTTELDATDKNGHHFLQVVAGVTSKFESLCEQAEKDLSNNLPDDVSGKVRVTVGQANLLISKKFQQFKGLCEKNINENPSVPFYTTCEDLAGFWDMVELQINDVMASFERIESLRQNNWINNYPSPSVSSSNLVNKPLSPRSKTPKNINKTTTGMATTKQQNNQGTPKSVRAAEAQKSRQEARKRLLAMKRAGRQRKISQSEEQENIVEIYAP